MFTLPAYAGLAESHGWAAGLYILPPQEALQKAEAAATKALEIDPNLGMAHHALAWVKYARYWDLPGAEREFQRAIELNPNNATAHLWYGMYLAQRKRVEESLAEMQRAKELDLFSSVVNSLAMTPLLASHQYDRLVEEAAQGLKTDPNDALLNWFLTAAYEQRGTSPERLTLERRRRSLPEKIPSRQNRSLRLCGRNFPLRERALIG